MPVVMFNGVTAYPSTWFASFVHEIHDNSITAEEDGLAVEMALELVIEVEVEVLEMEKGTELETVMESVTELVTELVMETELVMAVEAILSEAMEMEVAEVQARSASRDLGRRCQVRGTSQRRERDLALPIPPSMPWELRSASAIELVCQEPTLSMQSKVLVAQRRSLADS